MNPQRLVVVVCLLAAACGTPPEEPIAVAEGSLNEATLGSWSAPTTWPFVAIHTSVLPNGKVLSWGRTDEHHTPSASLWDPATATLTPVPNHDTNLFCAGHSFLPDGRLLVTGGHIHDGEGPADTNLFDYRTNTWTQGPPMNAGRWYPTNVSLGNGEVLVSSGTEIAGLGNPMPQVFTAAGTWRNLTSALRMQPYYPFMHVAPSGAVLYAGPEPLTELLYPGGTGGWVQLGRKPDNRIRVYGSSVMYRPGKVLTMGGADGQGFMNTAETLDLNLATPVWKRAKPMGYARQHLNATLLPDGTVLVTGGLGPNGAVFTAELWNPTNGNWTQLAANAVPRLYHSTSVLLPDGRVFSGGGGQPGVAGYGDYYNVEVYSPPYLFKGARPVITSVAAEVTYNTLFQVGTPDSAAISRVTWVRLGSVTHAYDENQRFVELTFARPTATTLHVRAPAHSNLAPPGDYMMFLLNAQGVPSAAKIVRVKGTLRAAPSAPTAPPCGTLQESRVLARGEGVKACGGRHELAMQQDGNLVLYQGPTPLWSSETSGSSADRAVMQGDGNLALYGPQGVVWTSGSYGANLGASLLVQDDGRLAIWDGQGAPLWTSTCGWMISRQRLERGRRLLSCDGRFSLELQQDGNLVLYKMGVALWSTNTWGKDGAVAVMQTDGNFVLYNSAGAPLWASGTYSPGASLSLQTDGNLVVYGQTGGPVWSSGTCCH